MALNNSFESTIDLKLSSVELKDNLLELVENFKYLDRIMCRPQTRTCIIAHLSLELHFGNWKRFQERLSLKSSVRLSSKLSLYSQFFLTLVKHGSFRVTWDVVLTPSEPNVCGSNSGTAIMIECERMSFTINQNKDLYLIQEHQLQWTFQNVHSLCAGS